MYRTLGIAVLAHVAALIAVPVALAGDDCRDVEWTVPVEVQGARKSVRRSLLIYIANAFLPKGQEAYLDYDYMKIPCDDLSEEERTALTTDQPIRGGENIPQLYKLIDKFNLATRHRRYDHEVIPDTLAEFETLTNFRSWDLQVVAVSSVKRLTRAIYRSPEGFEPRMSVAVTHDTVKGDLSAPAKETEIGVRRHDGNWDFYAYDPKGKISATSEFGRRQLPVPSTCLGCHFNRVKGNFSGFFE